VGSIAYFWWARSHIVEGREHVRAAMAQSSPRPFRRSYARALRGHGMLTAFEGNDTGAREAMNLGLAMWRELGDPIELGNSLATLGWAQFLASEDEDAYVTFDELLRVTTQLGDPVLVNQAKVGLGQVLVALARVDEARVISREIIEYSSKAGDRRAEHSGYHYLADCALIAGDCEESIRLYGESLVLANAIGDRLETSFEIEGIAMSLAGLGDHEKALRLRAAAREEWARHGVAMKIRFWDALVASYFAPAEEALGTDRTAAATKAGAAMSFEDAVAEALAAARR
jgi:tetratricopeptide (TPR) repeat protein